MLFPALLYVLIKIRDWSLPWRFKSYSESTGNPIQSRSHVPRFSRIQFGMHNSASGENEPRPYQEKEVPTGFQARKEFPDLAESGVSVTPFLPDARRLFPTTPCENKNSRNRPVLREQVEENWGYEGT